MNITNQFQYNLGISRYKLLSANAGVGSIVTSGAGTYVLISDINKWDFISAANQRITEIRNDPERARENWYKEAQKDIYSNLGIELVDDKRFIEFLKRDRCLSDLLCLAAIPHLALNEDTNGINLTNNPVIKRLEERGIKKNEENFTIPGTHFPKWFRNDIGELKLLKTWKDEWRRTGKKMWQFAPPRDPRPVVRTTVTGNPFEKFKELTQINLLLICENGHLSDIPWDRYLRWRSEIGPKGDGSNIFIDMPPCCDRPKLKWSESRNKSEGYGSVFLECLNCGRGSGQPGKPKVSLEGINNLEPICPGHKPWEISLEEGRDDIPFDRGCSKANGDRTTMLVALATGNNVYFANTFSSIYIPMDLVTGITDQMERALSVCEARYARIKNVDKTRENWAERKIDIELLDDLTISAPDMDEFVEQLRTVFVNGLHSQLFDDTDEDIHEQFRRQEYRVFNQEAITRPGLIFNDIPLSPRLATYFTRIKKVDELKATSVQLDLTRVRPKERMFGPDGKIIVEAGKNTFSVPVGEVYILPAVEEFGEGIFFEFSTERIAQWMSANEPILTDRIAKLLPMGGSFNANPLRQRIGRCGPKYLLVHTFSHLMMRELEFTCGYPTASLMERLYIAPDMAGVLIYTAEGSEGSMGGLIWQVEATRMEELLESALERAFDCSSDPLCWEIDSQGVYNLNLAACFSCALVAETACEERNLALDRRVLIDETFGFFKAF